MTGHIPVLLNEMLDHLAPQNGKTYVDATFGGGGYTQSILNQTPNARIVAIDQDPHAIERGQALIKAYPGKIRLIQSSFSNLNQVLIDLNIEKVDGIVMDLGVSSYQFDQDNRGFSFQQSGPLDMRMDFENNNLTAQIVVNTFPQEELANIIFQYGEERYSRRIAQAIVKQRSIKPFETTQELAELIKKVSPMKKKSIHPATLTFQALRIFVNNELIELNKLLNSCLNCLDNGGRLVGVTFHSLEDRILKQYLQKHALVEPRTNKYARTPSNDLPILTPHYKLINKKAISPSQEEIKNNPRARSAKLRSAIFYSPQALNKGKES